MKRNKSYKNELFTATKLMDAFLVRTEDHEFRMALGLSDAVYQYDEEGLITYCTTAIEPLVSLYPRIVKVELFNEENKTTILISVSGGISNAEVDELIEVFDGVLIEPLEEEMLNGFLFTLVEIETKDMNEYYKVRKG